MKDLKQSNTDKDSTRGTLTALGTEQTLIEVTPDPMSGDFYGGWIDPTDMGAADSVTVRIYNRIAAGGDFVQEYSSDVYAGVRTTLIAIPSTSNRYGVRVTLEQTAGTLRDFPWEFYYTKGVTVA